MPTLFEQLDTSLGDVDITLTVDGEVQKLVAIGETLATLIDNPPNEFGDYLKLLSELELPNFGADADLGDSLGNIRELIPADLGDLNGGLLKSLDNLEASTLEDIGGLIQNAVNAINSFHTLFRGDLTCGLAKGFTGAPSGDSPEPEDPPPLPPAPAEGEPNPGPQQAVVSQQQLDAAKAAVDLLPSPLTLDNLLPWLSNFWGNEQLPYNILRAVPIIDDLRGPLHTLTTWQSMSGNDIVQHFAQTVAQTTDVVRQNSTELVETAAADLNATLTPLDTEALGAAADDLIDHFGAIDDAITAGDLSGIAPDLTAIADAVAALQSQHGTWQASVKASLSLQIAAQRDFPAMLEDHIVQLISVLQPRPALRDIYRGSPPAQLDDSDADLQAVEDFFDQIRDFLEKALDAIDLSEVLEPATEPFDRAGEQVEQIKQQLVTLTLTVQERLAGVEETIDGLDLSSLQTDVVQSIEDFSSNLQSELNSQFAPVRTSLETALGELSGAVGDFDPASIKGEVEGVIDTIAGVFDDPQVQSAMAQLQRLSDLADSIDKISFTPLTDTVIEGIDEVKTSLESIDESSLDPPLPQMLGTAMSALPDDVTPLTDPLVDRLGDLVEDGPIVLIEQVREYPAQLFDQVRQYDPENLLGDRLATPYEDLLKEAERLSPAHLLEPVEREFDNLKRRLKDEVNPGVALQPLVELHRELAAELEKLNPGDLIEPLDQKIQATTQALGDAVDIGELTQPLAAVVEAINRQVDQLKKGVELIQHLLGKLDDLADAPAQLQTWIDDIFDKLPDDIDTAPLTSPLEDLAEAIDGTRALALRAHIDAQFSPLATLLDELDAGRRLSTLVETVTGISRSAIEDLPDSTEKSQLLALLDGFDVTDEEISGVLQQLATLTEVRGEIDAELNLTFTTWDSRYHRAGGTLDEFNRPDATIAQIKTWLREAIDRQIAWPLESVFGKVAALQGIAQHFVSLINDLTAQLDNRIAGLLAGPQAIVDLGENLQGLVDQVAAINLDFLQDSIDEIFDRVRDKFNDLNPAALQASLDEEFDRIIDGIDFELIVPADSFDTLDASFQELLEDLQTLNPRTLLVAPLQEVFEENLQPLIDSLDITPLLQAVIDRLTPLEDELRGEMDRVNSAYREMLAAAPDTSVSVNIGF